MKCVVTQRYLLPRLTASLQARISLQSHQLGLVERLHASARSLRATQEETFAVLPIVKPPGLRKDSAFAGCLTLEDLGTKIESEKIEVETVPHFTVLRCALASGKLDKQPTTEELFKNIEEHLPRLGLAGNVELQVGSLFLSSWSLVLSHTFQCRIDYGKLSTPTPHTLILRRRTHPHGPTLRLTPPHPLNISPRSSHCPNLSLQTTNHHLRRNLQPPGRGKAGNPSISTCSRP